MACHCLSSSFSSALSLFLFAGELRVLGLDLEFLELARKDRAGAY